MASNLYIMMGQPGSGKSTFVKNLHVETTYKIISRDAVRFAMVKPDEPYFKREKQVYREFINKINEAATKVEIVFADATHLNKASRGKLLRAIKKNLFDSINIIWVQTSLEESLARNEKRAGTRAFVPEEALINMYNSIEPPTNEEGFDNIYIIDEAHQKGDFNE